MSSCSQLVAADLLELCLFRIDHLINYGRIATSHCDILADLMLRAERLDGESVTAMGERRAGCGERFTADRNRHRSLRTVSERLRWRSGFAAFPYGKQGWQFPDDVDVGRSVGSKSR